jgi:hypothetical protein
MSASIQSAAATIGWANGDGDGFVEVAREDRVARRFGTARVFEDYVSGLREMLLKLRNWFR